MSSTQTSAAMIHKAASAEVIIPLSTTVLIEPLDELVVVALGLLLLLVLGLVLFPAFTV